MREREGERAVYTELDFATAASFHNIQYDNISLLAYSIKSMKYLPSWICIIAQRRMLACSSSISLEREKQMTHEV